MAYLIRNGTALARSDPSAQDWSDAPIAIDGGRLAA